MNTLHGILAELGIDTPDMHPEREFHPETHWVVDEDFHPIAGKIYEVAFGRIAFAGESKHVIKRLRIDGPRPQDWFDLDTRHALAAGLRPYPVKAFRLLT